MSSMKKVMLVTGTSRGIGAEIALLTARSGYRVGVNYLHSERAAQEAVKHIERDGGEAIALQANVGKLEEMVSLFGRLDAAFGPLAVLVNNAGVLASFRVDAVDERNVADIFSANVFSANYCSREAIRRMSTAHGGIAKMEQMAKTAMPLGRAGSAEEVAQVALWLASSVASYVHGSVIDVAGGR